jgi:hypothetical protein
MPARRFNGRKIAETIARNCRISLLRWVFDEK